MKFFNNTKTQSDNDVLILIIMILLSAGFVTCLVSSLCGTVGYLLGRDQRRTGNIDRRDYEQLGEENTTEVNVNDLIKDYEKSGGTYGENKKKDGEEQQNNTDSLRIYGESSGESGDEKKEYGNKNISIKSSSDDEHPSYLEEQIKNKM
jgi:hypothetical protein